MTNPPPSEPSEPSRPEQPPSPYEPPPERSPYAPPSDGSPFGRPPEGSPYGPPPEGSPYGPPADQSPAPDQPPFGQASGYPPGPQWGQQPSYAPQVPYGQYGPPPGGPGRGTNVLAILSLVFAFVFPPAGAVLGHLAKRQLRTSGEEGEQLATWGLILGYVFTGLGLLACCGWIALLAFTGYSGDSGGY
ncbi:DUF4190 domain-containing protein [Micromonospora sp. NPDC051006]|uniref:DUF4190 domain-containing protein n=1 Tax=Micromonospora sp. NPDC051006 TaxID=3364283 RepID=UPI0037AC6915